MKHADDSVPSPIMEEALFVSVKASRPSSEPNPVLTAELASSSPSRSGFPGAGAEGDADYDVDGRDDDGGNHEDEESVEDADEPSYGSSSPCSSSPCDSPHDGSVRSPFSSDDYLFRRPLHDVHQCCFHFSHKASDGGYLRSSSPHACADHKCSTSWCQTVGYTLLCCCSILHDGGGSSIHGCDVGLIDHGYVGCARHDGGGSSIHGSDLGLIDPGYMGCTWPHSYADVQQAASPCQTTEYTTSGFHSFEMARRMKHPSSCGLNDGYGCSTSSFYHSDKGCVVYSCCSMYRHSVSCHRAESETNMKQLASSRFSDGCKCSNFSHIYVHANPAASPCHMTSYSSTIGCDGVGHSSNTVSTHTDPNDKSGVRHGSLSQSGLLHVPVQPDEADAFEPHFEGTSKRGNSVAQDPKGANRGPGPKERLGMQQNISRKGRELGRMFQSAVDHLHWQVAEDLIPLADKQRLNDWLCIAVDSFWFLCTHKELCSATQIMEKLVKAGADCFVRAALRTSFLAACVWACQSKTRDLSDMVNILADRLHELLQECSGYEISSAEAVDKVKRMAEWALKCIELHCQAEARGYDGEVCPSTLLSAQFQLRAFKRFLELAENRLSGEDYTEAFEAACFPLSLFSIVLDSGWASSSAASAMQGLLGMLVEGGADNANQCCLEAARSGSTELLRMLLQIAQRNGIEVDVDVALGYASHYGKLETMECLVDVGNAVSFLDPLIRAAYRGCMPVVQWFVEKGCQHTELCRGLAAAVSSNRVEVAEYLMKRIPLPVLGALSMDIIKEAAEHRGGCLKGIAFLFQHDFLGSPEATYEVADRISKLENDAVSHELKFFCKHEWSYKAFTWGREAGKEHYVNVQRVLHRGSSPLQIKELPTQLQVVIAYLPLYKECAASCGPLLSQRLRGQLVEAALRLAEDECYSAERLMKCDKRELIALLKARLPTFLVEKC